MPRRADDICPRVPVWLRVSETRMGELIYWAKVARAEIELRDAGQRQRRRQEVKQG